MKYEEVEQKFTELLKNPDLALDKAQDLLSDLKADYETMASLEAGVAERDGRIKDLQDTNMKLFLKVSSDGGSQDEDEPKPLTFKEKLDKIEAEQNGGK